jgi:O2-independent ubiquinone biosynthesis protein UbiV
MNTCGKLSLGPILFFWSQDDIYDFYLQAAEMPVDIIYLGETVCSKRRSLRTEEWIDLAGELQRTTDKEIVLSTLSLLEAESELKTLRRICENGKFLVEANDMAAVQILSRLKIPFTTGPTVNIYNAETLRLLISKGLKRWVLPVELSRNTLENILNSLPQESEIETEVFAYGKIPLTLSARCFTARSHNLPKDDCRYKCIDYPDGRLLSTQEQQAFLALNGIQTLSAQSCNLIAEIDNIQSSGGGILRISPQFRDTDKIVDAFFHSLNGEKVEDISTYAPLGFCNGYWHGESGLAEISSYR